MLDPSGSLMKLLLNLKLNSYLGMLNVYYGEVLDDFLISSGKNYFPKSKISNINTIEFSSGYQGKFSDYNVSLTMTDHMHYRVIIYIISWILHFGFLFYDFFFGFPQKTKDHGKLLYYIRMISSRIHFFSF